MFLGEKSVESRSRNLWKKVARFGGKKTWTKVGERSGLAGFNRLKPRAPKNKKAANRVTKVRRNFAI
jgi:hypothetical protein